MAGTAHVVAEARHDTRLGGFRCTACGDTQVMPDAPMPVTEWAARAREFIARHEACARRSRKAAP